MTTLGPTHGALARVRRGRATTDGATARVSGRVVGTYLHGPVLARNPALADLLLGWACGPTELVPLDDRRERALRAERLRSALGRRALRR